MTGSYQTAVNWKAVAKRARSVIQSVKPRLSALREVHQALAQY